MFTMISRAILILNMFFLLTAICQPLYDDAPRRLLKRRLGDLDDRTVVVEKIGGLRVQDDENDDDDDRTVVVEKIAGSRLPDCSHACGSCSPCKLVTVRLVPCSIPAEAEPCPLAYRCMCQNKLFPVPR
ncbi:EPIDERMAL PATTERNING FACTOR-like protein 6 [Impatiens glandulifera]|uniref:EPIDERMAL PATTERNING FACTOR-like protein 6 n=1 Tax=Impatiens glandulifera TaxID=253017 RepID=UPI001FB17093|nr:EPIDERMAL PATTERNING FACTOR-like protein 6 [Impatiens glandulifera]